MKARPLIKRDWKYFRNSVSSHIFRGRGNKFEYSNNGENWTHDMHSKSVNDLLKYNWIECSHEEVLQHFEELSKPKILPTGWYKPMSKEPDGIISEGTFKDISNTFTIKTRQYIPTMDYNIIMKSNIDNDNTINNQSDE